MLAVGRVASLALAGWTRRRRRQRRYVADKQAFVDQVAATAQTALANQPKQAAWSGTKQLCISAVVDEALGVKSFYLTDPTDAPLPSFEPGQYLTCHFETAPGEKPLVRCYSLSDRPREEYYRLTVKLSGPPMGHPELLAGRASGRLHAMKMGDLLSVNAPSGSFFLNSNRQNPLVLVAGGIGVTPLVSMLATLAESNDPRPVYFFYGVRNSEEHPLRDQLEEIISQQPQIQQYVAYSRPLPHDRQHDDYQLQGRITTDTILTELPTGDYDYYLCGPGEMMQSLVDGLQQAGVPEDSIHFEAFGPASVRQPQKSLANRAALGPPPKVVLASSQQELNWDDGCDSLLDLIEEMGVTIESGCRAGNCGTCTARVIEGDVTTVKQPGAKAPDGYCLACISVPKSELVLDL